MASDCDIASSADFAILYAPYLACEWRTTIELTLTTDPFASASAGVKPWIIRSAPNTVSSIASRMWSKVVLANGFIDGTRKALLISTSTLPYALSVSSTRLFTCASSVMSVPTVTARRPMSVICLATSSSRSTVRAASTRSAPASAHRRASVVPSAGPTPLMTTTLSFKHPLSPTILSAICF